jgi:hypothetical protein
LEQTLLSIYVPKVVLEAAKEYARQHNTTVSQLVRLYLHYLSSQAGLLKDAPITHRLSGMLSHVFVKRKGDHLLAEKGPTLAFRPKL